MPRTVWCCRAYFCDDDGALLSRGSPCAGDGQSEGLSGTISERVEAADLNLQGLESIATVRVTLVLLIRYCTEMPGMLELRLWLGVPALQLGDNLSRRKHHNSFEVTI